jgi:hypothetical protein
VIPQAGGGFIGWLPSEKFRVCFTVFTGSSEIGFLKAKDIYYGSKSL